MLELSDDTLVVFVSDSHIGGIGLRRIRVAGRARGSFRGACGQGRARRVDPGGGLFDFLQIGKVEVGKNRASMTVERPEYRELFAALKRFREAEGKRVIYLPGNHDAESFWNEEIQETLRERGLVDEFAYYYLASVETRGGGGWSTASTATSSTPKTASGITTIPWIRRWGTTS